MLVSEIRDEAKGYSVLNDDSIVNDGETVQVVANTIAEYTAAAPEMFTVPATLAAGGSSWSLATAGYSSLWRVEKAGGIKVNVVPVDQPDSAFDPRVRRVGRTLHPVGSDPDPASDALTAYVGQAPTLPTAISDTIWAVWEERWRRVLALEVAKFYAIKRGDGAQVGLLNTEIERFDARFFAEAERWRKMFDEPMAL